MKAINGENGVSRWLRLAIARAILIAGFLFGAVGVLAQMPPPDDGGPTNVPLASWSFQDTVNWTSDQGWLPISFANLAFSYLGDGQASTRALVIDTNVPAWLQYCVYEPTNAATNLTVDTGSVTFWFAPDWASTNQGGTGPGERGSLFEVGSFTPDSSYGWWSIYVDVGGNNIYFSTQTNDLSSNFWTYVSAPVSWTTNYFHFIALTYSASNTALYLDGVLATNGPPLTVYPGPEVLSNGFWIGSSSGAFNESHGLFDLVATFNYPLDSNDIAAMFDWYYPNYEINPYNIEYMDLNSSQSSIASYGTNLALSPINVSNNLASLFVVNSAAGVLYEMQGTTNLARPNWTSFGFVDGSELTNLTMATVGLLAGNSSSLFLRIRSWMDSTGTGIPDWWWLQYFGQTTNVNAYASTAGDGYSNLQKFQMGLNPTNFTPSAVNNFNGFLSTNGIDVVLTWDSSPGAVQDYTLGRYVYNYDTGQYDFTSLGQVSGNTTSFDDVGAVTNGYYWDYMYQIQAVYAHNNASLLTYGFVYPSPPAPQGVVAAYDPVAGTATINWQSSPGPVASYTILRQDNPTSDFSPIATVTAGQTSYVDNSVPAGYDVEYEVEVNYAEGTSSPSAGADPRLAPGDTVSATIVRGPGGLLNLIVSAVPQNVSTIRVYWTNDAAAYYPMSTFVDFYGTTRSIYTLQPPQLFNPGAATGYFDVPLTNFNNGVYPITSNQVPPYGTYEFQVQALTSDGRAGEKVTTGYATGDAGRADYDIAFFDGRAEIAQNINFLLKGADPYEPFGLNPCGFDGQAYQYSYSGNASYVFAGFYYCDNHNSSPLVLNEFQPFEENNYYENFCYGPTNVDQNGALDTGGGICGMNSAWYHFTFLSTTYFFDTYSFVSGALPPASLSPVLSDTTAQWIASVIESSTTNYTIPNEQNIHGLVLKSVKWPGVGTPPSFPTAYPGDTINLGVHGSFFLQFDQPGLSSGGYYFARHYVDPLPGESDFSVTNTTPPLLVLSVGEPFSITAWARQILQNGYSGQFAYAEQYFDKAYLADANGNPTTNQTGVLSEYGEFFPTEPGQVILTTKADGALGTVGQCAVKVIGLDVDGNHDGTMDFSYTGPDQTSPSHPYYFWVDDSTDSGDYEGDGIPGQGAQGNGMVQMNHQWVINGRRDLVNLFPVYVNIGSLFQSNALSVGISATDTNWQFVLSQADGALRFAYTSLTPTNYMNFLRATNVSGNLAWWQGNPNYAVLTTISNSGVTLSPSFIAGVATNNGGIILVQAWENTAQPLVLTIYHGTNQIAQTSLYLSISGVEQMFRYKNLLVGAGTNQSGVLPDRLTDASVPNEPDTINKNVVFVHGYSVSPKQARGWFADMYKRLYWSGCHAKFYGVNWYGNDSQGAYSYIGLPDVTPNYQTNVVHAFETAPLLANFIATLTNTGPVVVMAHSLGNMVALSALSDWNAPMSQYFMLDAAVPMEAIDPITPINTNMVFSTPTYSWLAYSNKLWASEWFNLWPTNDARSTLSWNGRLDNFGNTEVYNFYSSGEEVLRTFVGPPPGNLFTLFGAQLIQYIEGESGTYVWAWQEKDKGRMSGNSILSSNHGGWGFNFYYSNYSVDQANALPPSQLQTNAFFDVSYDTALFTTSSSGSTYAQANRNRILSDAIPGVTLPLGANPVTDPGIVALNFDMKANENGWPLGRLRQLEGANWHHSDVRVVAYPFTYKVFNEIVSDGNLK